MFNRTLQLALCFSLVGAGASMASGLYTNESSGRPPVAAPVSIEDLQAKNAALQAQLAQMQAAFTVITKQISEQQSQIEQVAAQPQNPDPRRIEKETTRIILEKLFVNPELPGSDDEDGGQEPPLNYNFIYVENLFAELDWLKKCAFQPCLDQLTAAQFNGRIQELEEKLGIAEERRKKEKDLRTRLQRSEEENQSLRRRLNILEEEKKRQEEASKPKQRYAYN